MSNPVSKKAKKNIQDLAQDSFERIAKEPAEVARSVKEQVSGIEPSEVTPDYDIVQERQKEEKDRQKSRRLMGAHRQELEDIRRGKTFKEVQTKIEGGEDVNISAIAGLSQEQKDVLRTQKETALQRKREQQKMVERTRGLVEPTSKRRRGIFQRVKNKVEQMRTRIETKFKSVG